MPSGRLKTGSERESGTPRHALSARVMRQILPPAMSRLALGQLGVLLVAVGVGSCQGSSVAPSPGPTASAEASATAADCPTIDIRTPQGTRIDLTGTWTTGNAGAGNQVLYELRQDGDCLWGRAYSAYGDQDLGESFDLLTVGIVRPDFTAEVDLLELRVGDPFGYPSFSRATATLTLRFESTADGESLVLEIADLQARSLGFGAPSDRLFFGSGPEVGQVLTRSP